MKVALAGSIVLIATVLLAQAALFSSPIAAQAYDEDVYGGGVYDDSRTNAGTDDIPKSGDTSGTELKPSGASNPGNPGEGGNDQESTSIAVGPQIGTTGDGQGSIDEHADEEGGERSAEETGAHAYLKWISLGTLVAALLLLRGAIARKRRRERA